MQRQNELFPEGCVSSKQRLQLHQQKLLHFLSYSFYDLFLRDDAGFVFVFATGLKSVSSFYKQLWLYGLKPYIYDTVYIYMTPDSGSKKFRFKILLNLFDLVEEQTKQTVLSRIRTIH